MVLLDFKFPSRDGFAVLSHLRKQGFQNPVIMLTGQGNERIAGQAVETTLSGYLPKQELTTTRLRDCLINHLNLDGEGPDESVPPRRPPDSIQLVSLASLYRMVAQSDPNSRDRLLGLLAFHFEDPVGKNNTGLTNFIRGVLHQLNSTLPSPCIGQIHGRTYALLIRSKESENLSFKPVAERYRNHLATILNEHDKRAEVQCLGVKMNRTPRDPSRLINRCLDRFRINDTTSPDANEITLLGESDRAEG
jgi:CheY-like chemotaxis protein